MVRLFIFLLLMPVFAHASWSARALDFAARNFGYFPGPQSLSLEQRGSLATVYGGGMREVRFHEDMQPDEQSVRLPGQFRKSLRVHLRAQDHRAPLMVIVPGVFSNSDQSIAKMAMKWFSKMGYHVLTVPNCWSRDYMKADPVYTDAYPIGEARVVENLTEWAINEIGVEKITEAHIYGESLGALTAAIVYARDSQLKHPMFAGGATFTWPPIRLYNAIDLLDKSMIETKALYDTKCRHSIKRLKTKWRIMRGKYILQPTADDVECAPSVVAQYSFRKELIKLAEQVNDTQDLHKRVSPDLTFTRFVRDFAPRYTPAMKADDPYGSLRYWMTQMSSQAREKIRVITSEDDFLNDPRTWAESGFLDSPKDQLILAHWGGHIGLTNTEAYEGLLKVQFELQ